MKYTLLLLLPWLAFGQNAGFTLGSSTVVVGGAPGNASVELLASSAAAWSAASNASWLHLAPNSTNGSGSALIQFTYDANSGAAAQTGTLTIAGQTLTVQQAGSGFAPASALTTVIGQGLSKPYAVALDASGNLYVADAWNSVVYQWSPVSGQMNPIISAGLSRPHGIAVDGQGNVYIADTYNNAIKRWNPATPQLTTLVSSGLNSPMGVAVDGQGNVYIADFGNNAIEEWSPAAPQQLTTLVTSLNNPTGVAVDLLGNVYFADFRNNAIKQWSPSKQQVTQVLSAGLSFPNAVAVDGQGNIYLVDGNHNALVEWNVANQSAVTLVSSGINGSFGVAADGQGNFYIANTSTSSILKFASGYFGLSVTSLHEGAQAGTDSVLVQSLGGSLPPSATSDQPWLNITGASNTAVSFSFQANTAMANRTAHITIQGQQVTVVQSGDTAANIIKSAGDAQSVPAGQAFPTALQVTVTDTGGSPVQGAAVTFQVIPGPGGAGGTFQPTPPMPISTDQNGSASAPTLTANAIAGQFTVTASTSGLATNFTLNSTSSTYALGDTATMVGSAAGIGTVLLMAGGPWTAASNVPWMQIAAGSTSGAGNAVVVFNYAANASPAAQTGTLTIAGLTFTVVQAGTSYTPITVVTPLAPGLNKPQGVALDAQGNVYYTDSGSNFNFVEEWHVGTQQIAVLVSAGLNNPAGIAVDQNGNLYIADSGNNAIEEWIASQPLTPLASGLSSPFGVATDPMGNVYFSDTGHNTIDEWNATSQQISTIVGTGLSSPAGVAVDSQGNVTFADAGNNAIKQWNAGNSQVTTLLTSGLSGPTGVTADGQGNIYFADSGNNALKQWNAATQQVVTLPATGLNNPTGLAIDATGNLYVADTGNGAIKEFTFAYLALSATVRSEGAQAGSDTVTAQVLPANIPLTATSDQSWLVINSVTGGLIAFSYQANTLLAARTAHITVLGQQVLVTQSADAPTGMAKSAGDGQTVAPGQAFPVALQVTVTDISGLPMPGIPVMFNVVPGVSGAGGTFAISPALPTSTDTNGHASAPTLTANSISGPFSVTASVNALSVTFSLTNLGYTLDASSATVASTAGTGSIGLLAGGPWSATSNASWIQLSSSSGTGNAVIHFSYTANSSGGARTGTLTISGLTFTVTQAGTSYTSVSLLQTLMSTGLKNPQAVAVDASGNVYIADSANNAIKKWTVSTKALSTLVPGLNTPAGVAVDAKGNVYIADSKNNMLKVWNATNQQVTTLVSTGLNLPIGAAVDSQGNVYFADSGHNSIKEWVAATKAVSTLVTGLNAPRGAAVDPLGNVYFADTGNNAVKEWIAATGKVTTLVSTGLSSPRGVALDFQNNVYISDFNNNAIKQWNPLTPQVITLPAVGLKGPSGLAVDAQANVYIADTTDSTIREFTAGYFALGATSRTEFPPAGTDTVTALALPSSLPLSATSNQSWLKITGTAGGVIAFSFTANTALAGRTGQITVLGQTLTVTQSPDTPASISIAAGNGQSTPVGSAYPTALEVRVKDAAGNGVSGVTVTFTPTPGPKGASGKFASSSVPPTNANGYTIAPTLTANNIAGGFTVKASANGLPAITFNLTVTAH